MNAGNREAIEKRLQKLYEANGILTADAVIGDAKNPKSPLHSEFEWDTDKAAMEHWQETARRLIRGVRVIVTIEEFKAEVPFYVRDPDVKPNEQGFTKAADLRNDHDRAMASLAHEIERAEGAIRRARKVALSLGLENEIQFVASAIETVKKKLEDTA